MITILDMDTLKLRIIPNVRADSSLAELLPAGRAVYEVSLGLDNTHHSSLTCFRLRAGENRLSSTQCSRQFRQLPRHGHYEASQQ